MNLYTEGGAEMPNISSLASTGVVLKMLFLMLPVCSVTRSNTYYNSVYAPRIGNITENVIS